MKLKRDHLIGISLFFLAAAIRLLIALPGLQNPELLMRPDSFSYLAPASAMLEHGIYGNGTVPTALRVPLYPLLLVPGLWADGGIPGAFCILINILISSTAVPVIWTACREYGLNEKYSLFGTSVYLLTPTPAALAPMFLSDGLFGTVASLELLFLLRWFLRGESRWLFAAALTGGIGVLTRPLNLLWILPCLFAAMFAGKISLRRRIRDCLLALCLFSAVVLPWVFRNHHNGFGWRIDAVSADSLKHNAAIVESRATGKPAESFRQAYETHFNAVFSKDPASFPTEDSKLTYQETYLSGIIKRNPLIYFRGFFHPVNYVPDLPSLMENLGLSTTGRGTWDVIINHGLIAGVRHYFGGNWFFPILFLPFCLLLLAAYFTGAFGFFLLLRKKNWLLPLLFLPLGLYYMTVTGPVAYPRFSLPVLPYLALISAVGLQFLAEWNTLQKQHNTVHERID